MDKEATSAVVAFVMRCLNDAIHEEVKNNIGCPATSSSGFICSRAGGHEGPHIAGTSETVCHIWQDWEEKIK